MGVFRLTQTVQTSRVVSSSQRSGGICEDLCLSHTRRLPALCRRKRPARTLPAEGLAPDSVGHRLLGGCPTRGRCCWHQALDGDGDPLPHNLDGSLGSRDLVRDLGRRRDMLLQRLHKRRQCDNDPNPGPFPPRLRHHHRHPVLQTGTRSTLHHPLGTRGARGGHGAVDRTNKAWSLARTSKRPPANAGGFYLAVCRRRQIPSVWMSRWWICWFSTYRLTMCSSKPIVEA